MTAIADVTLRQLLRERLAACEDADLCALRDEILKELPASHVAEAAAYGLHEMLCEEERRRRRPHARLEAVTSAAISVTLDEAVTPAAPRYSPAVNQAAAALFDVYLLSYPTAAGKRRPLGDFTHDDVEWTRDQYADRAASNATLAGRWTSLLDAVPDGLTVRDAITRDQLQEILNA